MIIVSGANGKLGRAVVERLLERIPAEQIGVSVRDPKKAQALAERGIRVRSGDFDNIDSLAHAFEGASRVLIVSVDTTGDKAVRWHRTAINAARLVGAQRILYTSHVGADEASPFPPMPDHAATEQALRDSGVPYTALRNGFYAESAAHLLGNALTTSELVAPKDGPVDWISHDDLAEATAIALTDKNLDEPILHLTGAEAIDFDGIAAIVSKFAGRSIRRVVVPDDKYRASLVAHGLPAPTAEMLLGIFLASRQGAFARVDPTLERIIGRPAMPLRDVLPSLIRSAS